MPTRTAAVALALLLFAAVHAARAAVRVDDADTLSGAPILRSMPDVRARLHSAFGTGSGTEVLPGNADAFLRANVPLTAANGWRSFVYADLGAADSDIKWQGLAGMHHHLGIDLLGGWRHVTYHFSPGRGLDSLDFKGPYLGASLSW